MKLLKLWVDPTENQLPAVGLVRPDIKHVDPADQVAVGMAPKFAAAAWGKAWSYVPVAPTTKVVVVVVRVVVVAVLLNVPFTVITPPVRFIVPVVPFANVAPGNIWKVPGQVKLPAPWVSVAPPTSAVRVPVFKVIVLAAAVAFRFDAMRTESVVLLLSKKRSPPSAVELLQVCFVVPVNAICLALVLSVPPVLVKLPVRFKSPPAADDNVNVPPRISTLPAVIKFVDDPDESVPFPITRLPEIVQAPPAPVVRVMLWPELFIVKSYTLIPPNVALVRVSGCV
jgi:hypothetical protein